jgi:hypothetical protein
MPVDTERKTKTHKVIVGSAEINLTLSEDIATEDLNEFTRALREAAVLNSLLPPIVNVTGNFSAPWVSSDAPDSSKVAEDEVAFESAPDSEPEQPTQDPLVEAAKKIVTEAVASFAAILKKALEDL